MDYYEVTTLPDGYEPLGPANTGGFRVFIVFCCVAVLCLGGLGLHNWLAFDSVWGEKVAIVAETPALPQTAIGPQTIITNTFEVKTKDNVVISIEVETKGFELSPRAKEGLRLFISNQLYEDLGSCRKLIQTWADTNDIRSVTLKSSRPIPTRPKEGPWEGGKNSTQQQTQD